MNFYHWRSFCAHLCHRLLVDSYKNLRQRFSGAKLLTQRCSNLILALCLGDVHSILDWRFRRLQLLLSVFFKLGHSYGKNTKLANSTRSWAIVFFGYKRVFEGWELFRRLFSPKKKIIMSKDKVFGQLGSTRVLYRHKEVTISCVFSF